MVDNRLTILTEAARASTEVDRAAAREALKEAMGREVHGAREQTERMKDIQRARVELKIAPSED